MDTETPPRIKLGPLTTSWIHKHHQEGAKTLTRSPLNPAKGRDKLEESLRVQRSFGSTFAFNNNIMNLQCSKGGLIILLNTLIQHTKVNLGAKLGKNKTIKSIHKRQDAF